MRRIIRDKRLPLLQHKEPGALQEVDTMEWSDTCDARNGSRYCASHNSANRYRSEYHTSC